MPLSPALSRAGPRSGPEAVVGAPAPARRTSRRRWSALARAGAAVTLLDGAAAVLVYSGILRVVGPVRLWQGVAATVFGRGVLAAGLAGMALGLLVHAAVAYAWAAVFWLAYERLPALRRATRTAGGALAAGALYGVAVCAVMQGMVVPLAGGHGLPLASWRFALQAAIHVVAVGVPIVVIVRGRPSDTGRP